MDFGEWDQEMMGVLDVGGGWRGLVSFWKRSGFELGLREEWGQEGVLWVNFGGKILDREEKRNLVNYL